MQEIISRAKNYPATADSMYILCFVFSNTKFPRRALDARKEHVATFISRRFIKNRCRIFIDKRTHVKTACDTCNGVLWTHLWWLWSCFIPNAAIRSARWSIFVFEFTPAAAFRSTESSLWCCSKSKCSSATSWPWRCRKRVEISFDSGFERALGPIFGCTTLQQLNPDVTAATRTAHVQCCQRGRNALSVCNVRTTDHVSVCRADADGQNELMLIAQEWERLNTQLTARDNVCFLSILYFNSRCPHVQNANI